MNIWRLLTTFVLNYSLNEYIETYNNFRFIRDLNVSMEDTSMKCFCNLHG